MSSTAAAVFIVATATPFRAAAALAFGCLDAVRPPIPGVGLTTFPLHSGRACVSMPAITVAATHHALAAVNLASAPAATLAAALAAPLPDKFMYLKRRRARARSVATSSAAAALAGVSADLSITVSAFSISRIPSAVLSASPFAFAAAPSGSESSTTDPTTTRSGEALAATVSTSSRQPDPAPVAAAIGPRPPRRTSASRPGCQWRRRVGSRWSRARCASAGRRQHEQQQLPCPRGCIGQRPRSLSDGSSA